MESRKEFKGDIIIIDPINAVDTDEEWQKCQWGKDMSVLGYENYLYISSGDESYCKIINTDTGEEMGEFCTDSTVLVVLYFDELMKNYPEFSAHIDWPDSNTIIRNFDGVIEYGVNEEEFYLVGTGNINFKAVEV